MVVLKEFRARQGEDRHLQELRALTIAKEGRVPFVVELLDAFRPMDPYGWITIELVLVLPRLEPLEIEKRRVDLQEMATVMRQLCEALAGLARWRIVHRDIKPSNLMRDPCSQELRVIDFDLAVTECPGRIVYPPEGTKGYMAPETIDQGLVTHEADVFGAGMVLLQMLGFHLHPSLTTESSFKRAIGGLKSDVAKLLEKTLTTDKKPSVMLTPPPSRLPAPDWSIESACRLVQKMIEPNVYRRISARRALEHPFLLKPEALPRTPLQPSRPRPFSKLEGNRSSTSAKSPRKPLESSVKCGEEKENQPHLL